MARNKVIYALSEYAMIVTCSFFADPRGKPYLLKEELGLVRMNVQNLICQNSW